MTEPTILIRNADLVVTGNKNKDVLANTSLLVAGKRIAECPTSASSADQVIDASGKLVFPGFINGHHHFFQTAFRFLAPIQNAPLGQWVGNLATHARRFTDADFYNCATTSMAELILSGCTTTANHSYLIPDNHNQLFDAEVRAAQDIGMRFHPVRGSMTVSTAGGTPEFVCQSLDTVLQEIQRSIDSYHDTSFESMCRVAAGPCFPVFPVSSSIRELKEVIRLCRANKIRFHTHAAEESDEFTFTIEKHDKTPIEFLHSIDCLGEDVWLAHCLFLTPKDMALLQQTRTSVASCPSANSRGAGIARVAELLAAGVNVGVGVDGAAGNDTSNILSELRMLRTLQGAREGVLASYLINQAPDTRDKFKQDFKGLSYLQLDDLIAIATTNGARMLGRQNEIGSLEPGKLADIAIFDDNTISHAGSCNRVGTLFSCTPVRVWCSIINGQIIVKDGTFVSLEESSVIHKQRETTSRALNLAYDSRYQ